MPDFATGSTSTWHGKLHGSLWITMSGIAHDRSSTLQTIAVVLLATWLIRLIYAAYFGPLAKLPHAHWSSRFSKLWYGEFFRCTRAKYLTGRLT